MGSQTSENPNFTCEICIEPGINKFKNSSICVGHSFCTECVIKYIQVKLQDNVSNIKCPALDCHHSLDHLSCFPVIGQQLANKWCDALCESRVLGVDRVYCPHKECSELILNECGDGKLKRCVCPRCRKPFCFVCKVPWHAGYLCEEMSAQTRDKDDVAFGIVCETEGWKRCPRCWHCVERVTGCNKITCRCGILFCYGCGKRDSECECQGFSRCTRILLIITFIYSLVVFSFMLHWIVKWWRLQ